jgi:hypothetical protein
MDFDFLSKSSFSTSTVLFVLGIILVTFLISNAAAAWVDRTKLRNLEAHYDRITAQRADTATAQVPVTIITG